MLLNSLTTSHLQTRGKEMPPTFEMLLQYFSRHLRAGHLIVAVNKFNFFLTHHFHVGHNAPYLPPAPPQILPNHCVRFLLGRLYYPEEIGTNGYGKIGGEGRGGGATRCIVV